jgi:hypothetical protein
MENIEIRNGIYHEDVRKSFRDIIRIKHEVGFESFLETNYLASEVYFIDLIYKQNKAMIKVYEKIVTFHDISEGKAITEDIADQWYEDKITRDHYWYHKEYQSFLKERLEELNKPEQPEPEPLDLSDTSTIETPLFNNKFDNVKESTVIEYFTKNLVETKHISETDLFLFLDLAFDKMKVPKQKISFEHLKTQQKIINVFYNYYKITAGKPYGKQKKYINLLCDYFIGFEYDKIKTNFAK